MSKFTKGPWVNVGGWVDAESGGIICSLSAVDMKSESVSNANAHLIAAAPELYEALDMMMKIAGPIEFKKDYCPVVSIKIKARIALAKARGETK